MFKYVRKIARPASLSGFVPAPLMGSQVRIGPGQRTLEALHRRINQNWYAQTPAAQRARAVILRRRANWGR